MMCRSVRTSIRRRWVQSCISKNRLEAPVPIKFKHLLEKTSASVLHHQNFAFAKAGSDDLRENSKLLDGWERCRSSRLKSAPELINWQLARARSSARSPVTSASTSSFLPMLPGYSGPYEVGCATFTAPISLISVGDGSLPNGEPVLQTEEATFNAFYPAQVSPRSSKGLHWLIR